MSVTDKALKVVAERPVHAPIAAAVPAPAPTPSPAAIFTADSPTSSDPSLAEKAGFLAEVATHGGVATPLCIGIFGPAGSGKSSILSSLLDSVATITRGAAEAGLATPFLAGATTVPVVVQAGMNPAASLLHQVFVALERSHPELAAEASHAGSDPRTAAREASDRLVEVRQRLDTEQRKLDELSTRQARITDSVLFDASGSRVDAYARSNRGRIERSLRRFGFDRDSTTAYKEIIRDAVEPGSSLTQGVGWLRAFWAYRGQTRLIVVALVFFALAWILGALIENQGALITSIRSSSDNIGSTADWIAAHIHWLQPIKEVFGLAGFAALAINIVRALRFQQPIAKGITLLRGDVEARRRELDGLLAHQTHRVDSIAREAEAASVMAAEAERRLAARGVKAPRPSPLTNGLLAAAQEQDAARAFFTALSGAMVRSPSERHGTGKAPSRLVIGLDGFERTSIDEAAAFLDAAHTLLAVPGIVLVVAADRAHLAAGLAETDPALATARLNRIIQVPVQIGRDETPWSGSGTLVQALLRSGTASTEAPAPKPIDINRSSLDMPWQPAENQLIEALAPFAGHTPRAIKRFVNLYRVARADPEIRGAGLQDLAALAVGLALQSSGSLLDMMPFGSSFGTEPMDDAAEAAWDAAGTVLGHKLDRERHKPGLDLARHYASI